MEILSHLPPWYLVAGSFAVGACVGSFLNVVIHRLPRRESLIRPGSRCPECDSKIPPWANIPLLSYALLRGHCRQCGVRISPRYPIVEALTAVLFALLTWRWLEWGLGARLFVDWGLVAALIAVTFIDLDEQIIPNAITYPGIALGLLLAWMGPAPPHIPRTLPSFFADALAGLVLAGGSMWLLSEVYLRWRGRIGLGMGDVKLIAMLGAYVGLQNAFGIMMVGSLFGLGYALWLMAFRGAGRTTRIPFGPALAAAGILYVFVPGLMQKVLL